MWYAFHANGTKTNVGPKLRTYKSGVGADSRPDRRLEMVDDGYNLGDFCNAC
jgi:hypothetical protein